MLLKNSELPLYSIPINSAFLILGFVKYSVIFLLKKGKKENADPIIMLMTVANAEAEIPHSHLATIKPIQKDVEHRHDNIDPHTVTALPHTLKKLSMANRGMMKGNPSISTREY